jgi:predicted hotdog family 3-hydroxylacyl-ACP dehydratase
MLAKTDWAHLIPHAGRMCLLDAVVDWDDAHIHATSASHRDPAHPLRRDGHLHAVHLAEYGAQAMAVHGALLARARGVEAARPGMLVSLREVALSVEYVPTDGRLDVRARCLYADDAGAQYTFCVEHAGRLLASGRAAVIHPRESLP